MWKTFHRLLGRKVAIHPNQSNSFILNSCSKLIFLSVLLFSDVKIWKLNYFFSQKTHVGHQNAVWLWLLESFMVKHFPDKYAFLELSQITRFSRYWPISEFTCYYRSYNNIWTKSLTCNERNRLANRVSISIMTLHLIFNVLIDK